MASGFPPSPWAPTVAMSSCLICRPPCRRGSDPCVHCHFDFAHSSRSRQRISLHHAHCLSPLIYTRTFFADRTRQCCRLPYETWPGPSLPRTTKLARTAGGADLMSRQWQRGPRSIIFLPGRIACNLRKEADMSSREEEKSGRAAMYVRNRRRGIAGSENVTELGPLVDLSHPAAALTPAGCLSVCLCPPPFRSHDTRCRTQ